MNTKLNVTKWAIASIVVFLIITAVTFIMIRLGVQPWVTPLSQGQAGTSPVTLSARFVTYLSRLILSGIFTYVFTKTNYADKSGIGHGIRFGFGIGLLMYIPNFVYVLGYSDLPTTVPFTYMVVGVIQSIACGAAMAYFYTPAKTEA